MLILRINSITMFFINKVGKCEYLNVQYGILKLNC